MKIYRCLNCGFKFKTPIVKHRKISLPPESEVWCVYPKYLYYPIYVCPKCGSDAIEITEV